MPRKLIDETGKQYGYLTVISKAGQRGGDATWLCKCSGCGKTVEIRGHSLRRKLGVKSCGCVRSGKVIGRKDARDAILHYKYLTYKRRAKIKEIAFDLSFDKFSELCEGNCFYCGLRPQKITKGKRTHNSNGIDRVNSEYGYSDGNCVPCCEQCNRAKLDYSQIEFVSWISRAYRHMQDNNFFLIPNEIYLIPRPKVAS